MAVSDLSDEETDISANGALQDEATEQQTPERVLAHVNQIIETIKADITHHDKAFKQMKTDMFMAMNGRSRDWSESNYKANFLGRHVKTKTAALYAKNPKAVATRAERLDFAVWDESPESLQLAMQTIQMATQAAMVAEQSAAQDPLTGMVVTPTPQLPPGFEEAQALVADYRQGMTYRQQIDKLGKTLEILYARALRDQKPVDFKTSAKQLVRRTCTTGVGYLEVGFARKMGERPGLAEQLADARVRLDHLQRLMTEAAEGDITEDMAEAAELEASINALMSEPEIVLREGLVFDFPMSTKVIPDKLCKSLVGFIGARHLTIEYLFTVDEVKEMFPDADLKMGYAEHDAQGRSLTRPAQMEMAFSDPVTDMDDQVEPATDRKGAGLIKVWKHYDKPSGLVYFVADGYKGWLRAPAPPDVFVADFWPVFALTFNAVESEDDLFPPSDVKLLADQQNEHNRSRQGMREHREAARPRWASRKGLLDDNDKDALKKAQPFDVIELNADISVPLEQLLEGMPVPGVDPNLYETGQYFSDVQLVGGTQESSYGGIAKATATEAAIAANSTNASDGSSVDDLDNFLTAVARASSQILLREMSAEQVTRIVGPGAYWPELPLEDIADELFLEVEAGSSGRPNQAVEIENFTKMAPIIMQIPGISPYELAKEGLRRLDDRLDLTKMIVAGMPSIVAQNAMQRPGTGDPATDPAQQGGEGAANADAPPEEESPGTGAAFGSNQV
jgi:hypothetical protein